SLRTAATRHLQLLEEVEDEVQVLGRRLRRLVLDHEETLSVVSDVPALVVPLEKELRAAGRERRRGRDGHAHDLLVLAVGDLLPVGGPERQAAASVEICDLPPGPGNSVT